jgi:hypothetical protein
MKTNEPNSWQRPRTLAEAVRWSETPADIGYHLADFLDHMNLLVKQGATRRKLFAAICHEPRRIGDAVEDAYLAAVAVHLANTPASAVSALGGQADSPAAAAVVCGAGPLGARLASP